jgi:hypothetical protein
MRLFLLSVVLLAALTGCSVVPSALATAAAGSEKLVAAEHPQCDHGADLIRYLATGDNQGEPGFDVHYANEVGTLSVAQERAEADQWIEACDQKADADAALAAAHAQAIQQQQWDLANDAQVEANEAAQASKTRDLQNKNLAAQCAAASGRFDASAQRCYSTVTGNPSGINGEACTGPNGNPSYLFPVNGNFVHPNSHFPGCWT